MRPKNIFILGVIVCILAVFSGFVYAQDSLAGFHVVAENDQVALYLNESTVELALLDKTSGDVWHTNPYGRERKETTARGASKARLNSQLVITYNSSNQQYQMDSYNDCVVYDQYEIVPIDKGVRINYNLGEHGKNAIICLRLYLKNGLMSTFY